MEVKQRRTESSKSWYSWSKLCMTASIICLAIAAQSFVFYGSDVTYWDGEMRTLAGSTGAFLLIGALLCYDISRLNPAGSHGYMSLLMHYAMVRICIIWGGRFYKKFIHRCATVEQQQAALLAEILKTNADTLYGKKFNFKSIKSYEVYQESHPVATYEHFKSYVDKIVEKKAATNILCKLDPLYLASTSGTTGKPKIIPLTGEAVNAFMRLYPFSVTSPSRKGLDINLCKSLRMWYEPLITETPGGLKQSVMGHFLSMGINKLPDLLCDPVVFDVQREDTAFYLNAVFALRERDIGHCDFSFASQLLDFWRYVIDNAEDLCRDIEAGKLCEEIDIPLKMRVLLNRGLKPDKKRAREVLEEIRRGTEGLALRLWPCMQMNRVIVTGSMHVYAETLRKTYMKGIALLTLAHASSEGIYGFNISETVDDYSYALAFDNTFFEFIPENSCDKENLPTLLAHELAVGDRYEIVVTTKMGLYRYRTGDVVQIVKYEQQCPIYEFKYRLGQMLNVFWEKTPESVLQDSVLSAADELAVTVVDFTSAEDVYYHGVQGLKKMTRSYVLFIEIDGRKKLAKPKLDKFDEHLCKEAELYCRLRHDTSVAPMEVLQLAPGTFHALAQKLNKQSHSAQFKMPRVMRNKEHLDFLREHVL